MGKNATRTADTTRDTARRAAEQSAQRAADAARDQAITSWQAEAHAFMRTNEQTARMVAATYWALQAPGVTVRKLAASLQGTRKNPASDPINGAADIASLSASRIGHFGTAANLALKAGVTIPALDTFDGQESPITRCLAECLVAVQGGSRGAGTGVREEVADRIRRLRVAQRADELAAALVKVRGQSDPKAVAEPETTTDPETGDDVIDAREDESAPAPLSATAVRTLLSGLAIGIASGIYTGETLQAIEDGAHAIIAELAQVIGDTASIEQAMSDLASV